MVARGAGLYLREWLPGVRIVQAFNSVWDQTLAKRAHCDGPRIVIPLAADDAEAMDVAVQLVCDAGFDPVVVGDLSRAWEFDYGTTVYASDMTGDEVSWDLIHQDHSSFLNHYQIHFIPRPHICQRQDGGIVCCLMAVDWITNLPGWA